LTFVGRDDTDLFGFDARFQELGGDALDHGRLSSAQDQRSVDFTNSPMRHYSLYFQQSCSNVTHIKKLRQVSTSRDMHIVQ